MMEKARNHKKKQNLDYDGLLTDLRKVTKTQKTKQNISIIYLLNCESKGHTEQKPTQWCLTL